MSNTGKIVIILLLAASLFLVPLLWDVGTYVRPESIRTALSDAGPLAPFAYMLAMALAVVVSPIPSLPLNIAAGAFFGPLSGTVYSLLGALGGAVVSFLIARRLGRSVIERFLGGHVNFCTGCSNRLLTGIVFLSRLLPFISFDVVSYGAGLTKISLSRFALATLFGMIPLTFMYNYFGSTLAVGRRTAILLGMLMVALFFLVPRWLEKKGIIPKRHGTGTQDASGNTSGG